MATVREMLKSKGNQVWSVSPTTSLLQALELMAEKNVGALLVLQDDQVAGILSERDFARSVAKNGRCMIDIPVQDIMTKAVITVGPEISTEECMSLMTARHFRHLPVVVDNKLLGLISIGDVVKAVISAHESTINHLENYIQGPDYSR